MIFAEKLTGAYANRLFRKSRLIGGQVHKQTGEKLQTSEYSTVRKYLRKQYNDFDKTFATNNMLVVIT